MLLYSSWRNEENEFYPDKKEECIEAYNTRIDEISRNKEKIYPGERTSNLLQNLDLETQKPSHIFDTLDCQREQEAADDFSVGAEDDPDYESMGYTGNLGQENQTSFESCKYRKISLPKDDEIEFLTRRMVPEQLNILREAIGYCKDVLKSEKNIRHIIKPFRIIVHGGAGTCMTLIQAKHYYKYFFPSQVWERVL